MRSRASEVASRELPVVAQPAARVSAAASAAQSSRIKIAGNSTPKRAPAPRAGRARRAFLRFVHAQGAAVHLKAVQSLDRRLRLGLRHIDETEAARLACFPVVDEFDGFHRSMAFEQSANVLFSGIEGEIPHVDGRHPE